MPQNPSQSYASHDSPVDEIGEVVRGQNVSNVLDLENQSETPPVEDNGQYDYIKEFVDALSPEEMGFVCSYTEGKMKNPVEDVELAQDDDSENVDKGTFLADDSKEGQQETNEGMLDDSPDKAVTFGKQSSKIKSKKKDRVFSMKDFED